VAATGAQDTRQLLQVGVGVGVAVAAVQQHSNIACRSASVAMVIV